MGLKSMSDDLNSWRKRIWDNYPTEVQKFYNEVYDERSVTESRSNEDYYGMTEMENDIADEVWNSLSYDEMCRWNDDNFRRELYKKYWKERGYV